MPTTTTMLMMPDGSDENDVLLRDVAFSRATSQSLATKQLQAVCMDAFVLGCFMIDGSMGWQS